MRIQLFSTVGLLTLLASALTGGSFGTAAEVLRNPVTGTPTLKTISVIRFAPGGVLLIGDGPGSQLVAVQTNDSQKQQWEQTTVEGITDKLAARIGIPAKELEIRSMAVHPESRKVYFAVANTRTKKAVILTVDSRGTINEFALENVPHVVVPLPKGEQSPVTRITDLAWMGDRVLIGATASEEFAAKVCSIPAPLDANSKGLAFSTETYHVSHRKWETRAPMTTLMPYEQGGRKFVVGAFACTPVVRYPLDEVQPGAKVKGESVIELGSGNQPRGMFAYEKDGQGYVLMNAFRFHHERRPYGWSPYVTFRMELGLLDEREKLNESALYRLAGTKPATDRIRLVEEYFGVMHLDRLDKNRAVVIRQLPNGAKELAVLPLP